MGKRMEKRVIYIEGPGGRREPRGSFHDYGSNKHYIYA